MSKGSTLPAIDFQPILAGDQPDWFWEWYGGRNNFDFETMVQEIRELVGNGPPSSPSRDQVLTDVRRALEACFPERADMLLREIEKHWKP